MTYEELHDIVLQHGKSIYSFCRYLTANSDLADDLYQETFLKAAELCYKIDRTQNPKVFLIRISASLWKNQLRKEKGRQRIFPLTPLESEADVISSEKPPEVLLHSAGRKAVIASLCRKTACKTSPAFIYVLYRRTFCKRDFRSSAYPRWYSQKQALACKTHIKKGTGGTWI